MSKLRKRLPHVVDLTQFQFNELINSGKIQGHVTEKTDGMAFELGFDENGFYTRTSNSNKMRNVGDYYTTALNKFGSDKNFNPELSKKFDSIHGDFQSNHNLQKYLKPNNFLQGEIFHIPSGKLSEDGKYVRFVGTNYSTNKMGKKGMFILHTRLLSRCNNPENISLLSDNNYTFDHDSNGQTINLDVNDIRKKFKNLNHNILKSRKKSDQTAKEIETKKFLNLKKHLHNKLVKYSFVHKPKWGKETEGVVIHPINSLSSSAPKIKLVDKMFKKRKEQHFITEGGNLKVTGKNAEPITLESRKQKSKDFKEFFHKINEKGKIFGGKENIDNNEIFSGSSAHYFNDKLKDKFIYKFKKSFGDIDVIAKNDSVKHLEKILKQNKKIGKFTVTGSSHNKQQSSALLKHDDGKHHQIDFEFKNYENNKPSEFAKWSQNSHLKDLTHHLKGYNRNFILSSMTAAKGYGPGFIKKGNTYSYNDNVEQHSFSINNGLRKRNEKTTENYQGLPVYKELPKSNYITDVPTILKKLTGKQPNSQEMKDSYHFHGIASFAANNFNAEEKRKMVDKFTKVVKNFKFSKDDTQNTKMKKHTLNHISRHFPGQAQQILTEAKHFTIAATAGRFNGPTIEHQKLIDKLFKQKANKHYVFVMGPESINKTNKENPFTSQEKVNFLKKLYPKNADSFIAAKKEMNTNHPHIKGIKNPLHAMNWIYHKHKDGNDNIHLKMLAGSGKKGISKKAGGSDEVYGLLLKKYNNTNFPKKSEDDKEIKRMNFSTFKIIKNQRGNVSGSVMKNLALNSDPTNNKQVKEFKKMLHSKTPEKTAQKIIRIIQKRSK